MSKVYCYLKDEASLLTSPQLWSSFGASYMKYNCFALTTEVVKWVVFRLHNVSYVWTSSAQRRFGGKWQFIFAQMLITSNHLGLRLCPIPSFRVKAPGPVHAVDPKKYETCPSLYPSNFDYNKTLRIGFKLKGSGDLLLLLDPLDLSRLYWILAYFFQPVRLRDVLHKSMYKTWLDFVFYWCFIFHSGLPEIKLYYHPRPVRGCHLTV